MTENPDSTLKGVELSFPRGTLQDQMGAGAGCGLLKRRAGSVEIRVGDAE